MDLMSFSQLLGNLGEFIGSLAVVATLVYLSIQVHQVKKHQDIEDRRVREFAIRDHQIHLATSDTLAQAISAANEALGERPHGFIRRLTELGLSRADAERVWSYQIAGFRIGANTYYTSNDTLQRAANDSVIPLIYGSGVGALFWEYYSKSYLGPYKSHVDSLLDSFRQSKKGA